MQSRCLYICYPGRCLVLYIKISNLLPGSVQPPNWPDTRLGPFAPKDPKFPLPGNVGVDLAQLPQAASFHRRTVSEALLDLESEDVRKAVALDCYVKDISEENYGEEVLRAQVCV